MVVFSHEDDSMLWKLFCFSCGVLGAFLSLDDWEVSKVANCRGIVVISQIMAVTSQVMAVTSQSFVPFAIDIRSMSQKSLTSI